MAYLIDKLPALCPEGEVEYTPDLNGLIKWLETQQPERTYVYTDCRGECLLDLFAAATGNQGFYYGTAWKNQDRRIGTVAATAPYTFGAALSRARAARAKG